MERQSTLPSSMHTGILQTGHFLRIVDEHREHSMSSFPCRAESGLMQALVLVTFATSFNRDLSPAFHRTHQQCSCCMTIPDADYALFTTGAAILIPLLCVVLLSHQVHNTSTAKISAITKRCVFKKEKF